MKRSSSEIKQDDFDTESNDSKVDSKRSKLSIDSVYDEIKNLISPSSEINVATFFSKIPQLPNKPSYYTDFSLDFSTISSKYEKGEYTLPKDLFADVTTLITNLESYIPIDHESYELVQVLNSTLNKLQDGDDDDDNSKGGRRARSKKRTKENSQSESESGSVTDKSVQAIFFALIATLKCEDSGHFVGPTFVNLPDKKQYASYYDVIKEPIDLRMIAKKIDDSEYKKIDDINSDFMLMIKNAKTFNEPKSRIYQDAVAVHRNLRKKRHEAVEMPKRKFRGRTVQLDPEMSLELLKTFVSNVQDPLKDIIEKLSPVRKIKSEDEDSGDVNSSADDHSDYEDVSQTSRRGRGKASARGRRGVVRVGRSSTAGSLRSSVGTPSKTKLSDDDDGSLDDASHVTSPQSSTTTSTTNRTGVFGSLKWSMEEILHRIESEKDSASNQLCEAFIKLPSKRIYPDYYDDIKNPICLYNIRHKVKKNSYETLSAFMADIELMVQNAKDYNVEKSKIYEDAIKLLKISKDKARELLSQFPELADGKLSADLKGSLNQPTSPSNYSNTPSVISSHNASIDFSDDLMNSSKPEPSPTKRILSGRKPIPPDELRRRRNNNLYNSVWNFIDEENRNLREMFIHLPSREDYPDYYQVIPDPIDLTMIREKIDKDVYKDYLELRDDLFLLFRNAKHYNEEGSQIYEDATKLESMIKRKARSFVIEDHKAKVRREETEKNRLAYQQHIAMQQQIHGQMQTPQMGHPNMQQNMPVPRPMYFDPNMPQQPPQMMSIPQNANFNVNPQMGLLPQNNPNIMPQQQQQQQQQVIHHQPMPANMSLSQRMMIEVFYIVKEYRDSTGRTVSASFLKKPNKKENIQYYKVIRRPIDLCSIAKGILSCTYPDLDSFMNDLQLLFDNACRFNEPSSRQYKDAMLLHKISLTKQSALLVSLEANLPPGIAPLQTTIDINIGLRRLLTSLHNTMLTACDSEGRGLVDSLIAGDGTKDSKTSPTAVRLAGLHKAVAAGSYRRLDRLQNDWMVVLRLARIGDKEIPIGEQQRNDAIELTKRWIRLRDEICCKRPQSKHAIPNTGDQQEVYAISQALTSLIVTSATSSYTMNHLVKDLEEETKQFPLPELKDLSEASVSLEDPQESITINEKVYHKGSYIKFTRDDSEKELIGLIIGIKAETIHLSRYMRPEEAKPSQRRRLFTNEVFRTPIVEEVKASQVKDTCHVLHISKYIKFSIKDVDDSSVNICESHFSPQGNTFIKISNPEEIVVPSTVELVQRASALVPNRLSPIEPLEAALEQVDKSKYDFMVFPIPHKIKCVISAPEPEGEAQEPDLEFYDQYVHENGFYVKKGDYLYVGAKKTPENVASNEPRKIMRVEKLWKKQGDDTNAILISGPSFISPMSVEHLPTRMFYSKEIFISSSPHATLPLGQTTGKCYVMRPSDYAITRPTEFAESDIFVCESKYFEEEKGIRKLKRGLKRFQLSGDCIEEEFFSIPYVPLRKEPTPQLNSLLAKETILEEQLNKNPALAYSVVVQASMESDLQVPNKTIGNEAIDAGAMMNIRSPINSMGSPNPAQMAFHPHPQQTGMVMVSSPTPGTTGPFNMDPKKPIEPPKMRKPPSGYVIYAGEQRKVMLQTKPDTPFGEISREIGQKWRQLTSSERDIYERKAGQIKKMMEDEDKRNIQLYQQQQQQQMMTNHHLMNNNAANGGQMMSPIHPGNNLQMTMPNAQNPYQQQMQHQMQANQINVAQQQHHVALNHPGGLYQGQAQQQQHNQMVQILPQNYQPALQQNQQLKGIPMQSQQSQPVMFQAQNIPQNQQQPMNNGVQQNVNQQNVPSMAQIMAQQQQQQQQAHQNQQLQQQQPGKPLFVSVPPKACRVLHSDVYQKYIDRLRKPNVQGLSDWRGQMMASLDQHVNRNNYQACRSQNQRATLIEMAHKENAIAASFLNGVQLGSLSTEKVGQLGNKTQIEALWELRDLMMVDAMKIQQRCLTLEEL